MQHISELEPHNRGAYGGCIGYIGLNGNLNQAIVIRTFIAGMANYGFRLVLVASLLKAMTITNWRRSNNKLGALVKAIKLA